MGVGGNEKNFPYFQTQRKIGKNGKGGRKMEFGGMTFGCHGAIPLIKMKKIITPYICYNKEVMKNANKYEKSGV